MLDEGCDIEEIVDALVSRLPKAGASSLRSPYLRHRTSACIYSSDDELVCVPLARGVHI